MTIKTRASAYLDEKKKSKKRGRKENIFFLFS